MNTSDITPPCPENQRRGTSLSDADWETIDTALQQLEEAWRRASQPDIGSLVPPVGNPVHLRVLVELVKADQECRWKSGVPTKIEDYFHAWPELSAR